MLTWKIVGASKVSVLYYLNIMLTWKIVGASKVSVLYYYLNIMLTWKIVGASKVSVLYIYIDYLKIVGKIIFKKEKKRMTWQLMWRNVRAAALNATLQLLIIYR